MADITARQLIEGVAEESAATERPQTETLDRLYLEWSQFTGARNTREIELAREIENLRRLLNNWLAWFESGGGTTGALIPESWKALQTQRPADAPSRTAT
ncbi:MAG: hypothetical protein AAGI72_23505 [Pseudomonadota bacterium]